MSPDCFRNCACSCTASRCLTCALAHSSESSRSIGVFWIGPITYSYYDSVPYHLIIKIAIRAIVSQTVHVPDELFGLLESPWHHWLNFAVSKLTFLHFENLVELPEHRVVDLAFVFTNVS